MQTRHRLRQANRATDPVQCGHRDFRRRLPRQPGDRATADNSTLVTFTLTAAGAARTRLRVVESGLDELDWPDADKQKFADEHTHGWQEKGDALRDLFASRRASSP